MVDGTEGSAWLVWDETGNEDVLVELPLQAVVRLNTVSFCLDTARWRKIVDDGHHAFMSAGTASKIWKANQSTIAVVEWGGNYVWCMRYGIPTDDVPHWHKLRAHCGTDMLWPMDPHDAKELYLEFQAKYDTLELLNFYPSEYVGAPFGTSQGKAPFRWRHHPLAQTTEVSVIQEYTRFFLASVRAVDRTAMEPPYNERRRINFVTLPASQLGDVDGRYHDGKRQRKPRIGYRPFESLPNDLFDDIVGGLAKEYINTPAYGAHRNWTALRAVNRAFLESTDQAAIHFMRETQRLMLLVVNGHSVAPILALRDWLLPTGLTAVAVRGLYGCLPDQHLGVRTMLLNYMRLRSRKRVDAHPPPRPPPSAPYPVNCQEHVLMSYSHGGPSWWGRRQQQLKYEHCTRSKAPLLPVVTLKLKVERWQVHMMEGRGWHVE
jgi:hypothetical protein